MRKNQAKAQLLKGHTLLNGWLSIPSSLSAEGFAHQGFDCLTIDMQHGAIFYDTALPMLQAISTTDVTPMARVPWNEPGIIMKSLDAGCMGIICPLINDRAECERFVRACLYPPMGYRSFGPTRARLYAGDDYGADANTEILTFAMIETAAAMKNLDDIMSVRGLDAVFVGPADLSLSLGGAPGVDWEDGPVVNALDEILASCKRHAIVPGIHAGSAAYAKKMMARGFQFITISSDLAMLLEAAKGMVHDIRGTAKSLSQSDAPY